MLSNVINVSYNVHQVTNNIIRTFRECRSENIFLYMLIKLYEHYIIITCISLLKALVNVVRALPVTKDTSEGKSELIKSEANSKKAWFCSKCVIKTTHASYINMIRINTEKTELCKGRFWTDPVLERRLEELESDHMHLSVNGSQDHNPEHINAPTSQEFSLLF